MKCRETNARTYNFRVPHHQLLPKRHFHHRHHDLSFNSPSRRPPMSTDNASAPSDTIPPPEAADILRRPDLKRTLKDLLVQDEVSDSDVEMLEKHSTPEQNPENEDVVDPDMCVECGDQVCLLSRTGG